MHYIGKCVGVVQEVKYTTMFNLLFNTYYCLTSSTNLHASQSHNYSVVADYP